MLALSLAFALTAMQTDVGGASFSAWLAGFRGRATAAGVGQATVERELAGLAYDPRVVALDRAQPDARATVRPSFADYLARHLNEARIARGRVKSTSVEVALARAQARYGVPAPVIVAIWGNETDYGAYRGGFDLVRSLATLAYEGRRSALFERELTAALRLIDRRVVTRAQLKGSWAGATGQPQFLPSSFDALAVDGDGNGTADIWGSDADTVASIAHYLNVKGWRAGERWAMPVSVPPGLDRWRVRSITPAKECVKPLAQHSRWLSVAEWRALGVAPAPGEHLPGDKVLATLIEPDGPGQGGYLTYGNYRAILAYNCSNFYALSVGLLADRLRDAGAGGVQ